MEQSTETTSVENNTEVIQPKKFDITMSTKDCQIVSTGSVIILENDYVEFKINNLKFHFRIATDEDNKQDSKPEISMKIEEIENEKVCSLLFKNFRNDTKMFLKAPVGLASFEQKGLKLVLYASAFNGMQDINILMNYTWLWEK